LQCFTESPKELEGVLGGTRDSMPSLLMGVPNLGDMGPDSISSILEDMEFPFEGIDMKVKKLELSWES